MIIYRDDTNLVITNEDIDKKNVFLRAKDQELDNINQCFKFYELKSNNKEIKKAESMKFLRILLDKK